MTNSNACKAVAHPVAWYCTYMHACMMQLHCHFLCGPAGIYNTMQPAEQLQQQFNCYIGCLVLYVPAGCLLSVAVAIALAVSHSEWVAGLCKFSIPLPDGDTSQAPCPLAVVASISVIRFCKARIIMVPEMRKGLRRALHSIQHSRKLCMPFPYLLTTFTCTTMSYL